ncbi:MAG: ATP-dependent 6-phosphofructokinase [Clostridiales bacterium]
MKRIGILTSGGDCPGLNAAIRSVAKASYEIFDCEIIGILDGFKGLIYENYKPLKTSNFSGILTRGGTILGSSRTPYKKMRVIEEDNIDKVKNMIKTYEKLKLDCVVILGGNGTHKNANLLRESGLNVVVLPKTIDNDICGTDVTFGFHSAIDIATSVIDRVHTTADSHDRVMIVELMGNKAGWLTLYSGIAGGADVILIPELPYKEEKIISALEKRRSKGKDFSIIVVAEGVISEYEKTLTKKELKEYRLKSKYSTVSYRLKAFIERETRYESRVTIPGYQQRGGTPSPYDRLLATSLGVHAAKMISNDVYGKTISIRNGVTVSTPLEEVAGKYKNISLDDELLDKAKLLGVSMGI